MRRFLILPLAGLVLAACDPAPSTSDGVAITATDTACTVAQTTFSPGDVKFTVTNKGAKVTEVYVYAGSRIVTEVENIGPGTSRAMTATLTPGAYEIACKPGQTGDGIRTPITVTGAASAAPSPSPTSTGVAVQQVTVAVSGNELHVSGNDNIPVGAEVTFVLDNTAAGKRELEIIDPNHKEVAAIEAASNGSATVVVKLTLPGTWTLKIEDTDLSQTFTVRQ